MDVTFKIRRQNPDVPGQEKSYWQEFELADVDPTDRVLEMLHRIKWEQDGSLSLRRSCAHGVCGSDAMRINGVNRLACKILIRDLGERVQVEPILGLPVVKDLIVDMEPFFDHYKRVMPYFVNERSPAGRRPRTAPNAGGPRALRRFDQVHPLRLLHHLLPELLGEWPVCGSGGHCGGASLHIRLARSSRSRAAEHAQRAKWSMALPNDFQLYAGLPARY